MHSKLTFSNLKPGDKVRITGFNGLSDEYRRQLLSLGMTPGVEVEVQQIAPLGDPVKILVRGFRLSLRRQEAAGILVEAL